MQYRRPIDVLKMNIKDGCDILKRTMRRRVQSAVQKYDKTKDLVFLHNRTFQDAEYRSSQYLHTYIHRLFAN
jgi:hypothetical protein